MPTVPRLDAPTVAPTGLPGFRQSSVASPSLFSAGADQQVAAGKGLMQAGAALNDMEVKLQERENADMLFRAESTLKDDYLKHEAAIRQRRGQNAWGVTAETDQWFADQEKAHSEALGNDVQRKLFSQQVAKLRQSAMGTMSAYETSERNRSLEESAQASIVGSINMAAANAPEWYSGKNSPTRAVDGAAAEVTMGADGVAVNAPMQAVAPRDPMAGIKSDILKRVQVMSDLNGWSPERKQAEEAKHLTNLHKQVIQSLVDANPTAAREYFETNKAEINGSEYDGINKYLKVGGLKKTAQEAADAVTALGMTEQEALAHARQNYEGDEEEAVVSEIKTRFAESTMARERTQRDASDQAWGIYARTGRLNAIPASVLAQMDGRDLTALKDHARVKAEGRAVKTDFNTYYELSQMAAKEPEAFRSVDLRRYTNKLAEGDLESFARLQASSSNPDKVKEAATLTQQLSNTHDMLGWRASDREKMGAFDKSVTDAIQAEQTRRGKELTYEERQAVIDRMAIEGDVNGAWFGGKRRLFEVQGTPEAAKFVPEIPPAERDQLVKRFTERRGRAPTKDEILQTYKAWKGL